MILMHLLTFHHINILYRMMRAQGETIYMNNYNFFGRRTQKHSLYD